ncbi:MAG: hypothetical protein CVV17_04140 [Gammaproteobacteria bacterium HGW-Gammaproteobacteria-7]|nr:MAG: hypothetical protein CVV17_04140 [Gammaproteobacteria bacterium HGW-Gammaproteobacteria-7]
MRQLEYTLRFLTPAFLGNAEQNAQWRTPPIKHLLREWWRVTYAAEHQFAVKVADMRHEEGLLFGHAWLDDDLKEDGKKIAARRSLVRLRLEAPQCASAEAWGKGTQQGVAPLSTGLETGYAWFGLIKRGEGKPDRNAINAAKPIESIRVLKLAVPEQHAPRIEQAIRLIHAFGQLGSRSRGGWGSLHIDGFATLDAQAMHPFSQALTSCLKHDWAMALASDQHGLCVWQGQQGFDSWDKAMRAVAGERKQVRTALKLCQGKDLRAALGFATPGRMPSPLRWKIVARGDGKLEIRIFAMPHRLPTDSNKSMTDTDLANAWHQVVTTLDASKVVRRLVAGKVV